MNMQIVWIGLAMATLACIGTAGAAPTYHPVEPMLHHIRGGMGNVFQKLQAGKDVRIAYFGGSITAQEGWRPKTLKWLQETYPRAHITEINAAIGGTGSDLGVFRFRHDVLDMKPDLIFVEFAVNDGGAAPEDIWRQMEGIVRQAWEEDPTIDICYVYTFAVGQENDLNRGFCARAASSDEILADYYGIPSINMAMEIARLAREGQLWFTPHLGPDGKPLPTPPGVTLFSDDGVHPLDAGHDIYTRVITDALKAMAPVSHPGPHVLKAPMMPDNEEQAKMVPLQPAMLSPGWTKLSPDTGLGKAFHNRLPEIWEATKPGETIHLRFKGATLKLYDLMGPDAGEAICTVDGKTGRPISRFDRYCTYHRLAMMTIAQDLPDEIHTVTIAVSPIQPDRSEVVNEEKNKPGFDPKEYEGTVLRIGVLMVIGDVLPPQ